MEKQTAVEWLVKEFSEILGPLNTKPMQDLLIVDAINQAKAMEKEQIFEAWNTRAKINDVLTFTDNRTAEQYYKEIYESND